MDANRLGRGEMIAAVSALVLLLVMFIFSWFSVDVGDIPTIGNVDTGFNAWDSFSFIDLILFVTIVVAIGGALLTANATSVNTPVAISAVTAGLGILCVLLLLFRIISPPDLEQGGVSASDVGLDTGRSIGVFLGFLLTIGIAYGGWTAMSEEGTSFSDQADRVQNRADSSAGGATGGTAAPPPPPPATEERNDPPPPPPAS